MGWNSGENDDENDVLRRGRTCREDERESQKRLEPSVAQREGMCVSRTERLSRASARRRGSAIATAFRERDALPELA